jgi:Putative transposase
VVDGVFEEVQGGAAGDVDNKATSANVIFHLTTSIDAAGVALVQATLRKRILRAFVGRDLLESFEAQEMLAYQHSGFSLNAGVCIQAHDRAALQRLLRYCARPPFAMERLRKEGKDWVYHCTKQHSEPSSDKRGAKVDELHLTPLELIERIAALVPPQRIAPARGPPLWQDCGAQVGEATKIGPDWDLAAQPAADYEVDRLVNW